MPNSAIRGATSDRYHVIADSQSNGVLSSQVSSLAWIRPEPAERAGRTTSGGRQLPVGYGPGRAVRTGPRPSPKQLWIATSSLILVNRS